MSVSTQGTNHTIVISVVRNSHKVVRLRPISVSTLGINDTNLMPVGHNSQEVAH